MFKQTLAAAVVLTSLALGNTSRADFDAVYDEDTKTVTIWSGYIHTDEYFDIYIDNSGRLNYLVIEDAFGQTESFYMGMFGYPKITKIEFYGDDDADIVYNNTSIQMIARGGRGNDYIQGGSGNDRLYGEEDDDTLIGKKGHDYLEGGEGFDHLIGNQGNDDLYPGTDVNEGQLKGGYGNDRAFIFSYTVNSYFNLGGQAGDETVLLD